MSEPIPLYQGEPRQQARQRFADLPATPHVQDASSAMEKFQKAVVDAGESIINYHNFNVQQEVQVQESELDIQQQQELDRIFNLANGAEGSWWDKDGKLNTDAVNAWSANWEEKYRNIPRNYWGSKAIRRDQQMLNNELSRQQTLAFAKASAEESRRSRKAFDTNLTLATESENWDKASSIINNAFNVGRISEAERDLSLLRLGKTRLKSDAAKSLDGTPVSVNIGGTEYSGLSAALAMDEARQSPGPAKQKNTVNEQPQQDTFFDASPAVRNMPEADFGEIADAFSFDFRVLTLPGQNGKAEIHASSSAPECVQRVAAVGTAHGGIDDNQARMMVSRITLDMVADNPTITDTQALSVFDNAGIYEAIGAGDSAVGKARCQAIVSECIARGKGDTDKLSMGSIVPLITAQLNSTEFIQSREWGRVATLNPNLKEGTDWDKSDLEEEARKKWFALYDVYALYRAEYNPKAEGKLDKDEFEENAQAFHDWYMKNKYSALKKADLDAARDWYTMRVTSELRDKAYASADGKLEYKGYGNDLQLARAALRELPPANLGADELVSAADKIQKQDAKRSEAFRRAAKADYEKLHGLKQSYAENSEKSRKEKEKQARAEERKAEKAARDAEKQAEKIAARKLSVARSAPRESAWKWDGHNAPDGASPACLLPESEAKRLVNELGYDGSQDVFLQLDSVRVQVVGISKSGKVELNSTAVSKIQKRPTRKKGETWKTSGTLGFSYYFKTSEAK